MFFTSTLFSLVFCIFFFLNLSIAALHPAASDPFPPGFGPSGCSLAPRNNPWSLATGANPSDNDTTQQPTLNLPTQSNFPPCRQIARFTIPTVHGLPYTHILPSVKLVPPFSYWLVYELYGELQLFEKATRRVDSKKIFKRYVLAQEGPYPFLGSWMYEAGTVNEYSEVGFEINIIEVWEFALLGASEIALYELGSPKGESVLVSASGSNGTGLVVSQ